MAARRTRKYLISRQSGGTSGDLTVRGHKPKTPTRRRKPPVTTLNVKPSDLGFDPPSPAATRAARAALPTLPQLGSRSTSTPRRPEPRASQPSPVPPLLQRISDLLSPDPNRRSLVAESVLKPLTDLTRTARREIGKGVKLAVELPDQRVDSVLGVPTLGKPKLGEVTRAIAQTVRNMPTPAERRAAAAGRRSVAQRQRGPLPARYNQRGELTIPSTRKAVRQLRRAQAQAVRSRGGIEGITHPGGAKRFAEALARFTGLNPRFVGAWVQAEGGAFPAGGEAGPQNWLGVGYPGRPTAFGRSGYFSGTPEQAAKATADWMRGRIGGEYSYRAAPSIQSIIPKAAGKGPQAALRALAESGWGTNVGHVAQIMRQIRATPPDPKAQRALAVAKRNARALGIDPNRYNPTPFNGDVQGGGTGFTVVRADAKGMVDWATSALNTDEGTAKQLRWAARFGLGPSQPWCANFVSNGLLRRGITDLPSNPNSVPSYEAEWGPKYGVPGGLRNAKPGDILTFGPGRHIGIYVGNGEMISGNSSDTVARTPVDSDLSMVIRPPYKGGKVRVPDAQLAGSTPTGALAGVGGAPAGGGGGGAGQQPGGERMPVALSEVPISDLLRTLSLDPADVAAEGEEALAGDGTIARLLARRRL